MKCCILSLSGVTRTSVKNCFQHRRGLAHCISYIIIRYQPRSAFTTAAMLIITHRSRQHHSPHRTSQHRSRQHHSPHRTSQTAPQQANIAARTAHRRQHRSRQHRASTAHRRQSSLTTLPPLVTPVPFNPFMAAGKIIFRRSVNLIFAHAPREKTAEIPHFSLLNRSKLSVFCQWFGVY
jgi:hypothetical protein